MKAVVKVTNSLSIESEKESVDELFKEISTIQETFEDTKCGVCGSTDIKFVVREAEGFEFYEMHCKDTKCRARLSFGHSKENKKLYAKRCETETQGKNKGKAKRDENGKAIWLPNNGWAKYVPNKE
jgi:hypothetical protein